MCTTNQVKRAALDADGQDGLVLEQRILLDASVGRTVRVQVLKLFSDGERNLQVRAIANE